MKDRRKIAWVGASVAGHAVVIAALAWGAVKPMDLQRQAAPVVYLDIEPRLVRPSDPVRKPTEAARRTEARQAAAQAALSAVSVNAPSPLPSPPRPRMAAPAPAAASPPPADPWQVRREDMGDAVARSLRAGIPGCRTPDILSQPEREACDQTFGAAAALAPPITGTGNARRDARFAREGARALAEYEAMRRPLGSGVGVVGPADCIGSNFGTGCAGAHLGSVPGVDMRQGSDSLVRQPSNKLD
ncbi:hypothetical protein ASG17_08445 [Brevundimonas sp. Leaf363]|nr:hypothetical protein ASG17_08445 [Brevundimonas sp. Leaf363]